MHRCNRTIPAVIALMLVTALGAHAQERVFPSFKKRDAASARIVTGQDYVAACGSREDIAKPACHNSFLGEVFALQTAGPGTENPFRRCPIDIRSVKPLEEFSQAFQPAFVRWLNGNPSRLDEPVEPLAGAALGEIDVCDLR